MVARVIEREFRYLVSLAHLTHLRDVGVEISQGYLVANGSLAIRVRRRVDGDQQTDTLTVKSALVDAKNEWDTAATVGSERHEVEVDLTGQQADELWPLCANRIITKRRHLVDLPGGGLIAEVDVFSGRWVGLAMVEVEFADRAQMLAFEPPSWFGRNVTADPRFTNGALALASVPDEHELRKIIQAECGTMP
jgi:adenylate cyclase